MLNEDRVILMTRMASYEKGEGRKNVKIGSYFRSDYISVQIVKSFISVTLAFAIVFGLNILYDLEAFMENLYKINIIAFVRNILTYYCIAVVSYGILTYIVCTYQYAKAQKSLKSYYHNLKKLNSLYSDKR